MKIILVRHTTTDWNLAGKMQGQTDTELCTQGRREALELVRTLSPFPVTAIHSSDLKRARQTAEVIANHIKMPVHTDRRLRECSFGSLEGLTRAEAIAQHGDKLANAWDDQYREYDFRKFGGEYRYDVLARHLNVLIDLKSAYAEDSSIMIVGHGRGLNTLLAGIGKMPDLKRGGYKVIEI